mgnify:CR=1 FL=1
MQYEPNQGFNTIILLSNSFEIPLSAISPQEPRAMKWETNGELAQRDLSELVSRLLDVESTSHTNELSRLSSKYQASD